MNDAAEITPYQNHVMIEHLKVKTSKLEDFCHEADKNISQLISNQKLQQKELQKLSIKVQRLVEKELKAEGVKDFLRKIWSFKSLYGFLFLLIVMLFTHNDNFQNLLTKVLGF